MRALVTGSTGFIGANLVRLLLAKGYHVRTLVRRESSQKNLRGLDVELVYGDLLDPDSLFGALEGVEELYHVAGYYQLWSADPQRFYQVNVEGTENILKAARRRNLSKIVYTSTVGTLRYPKNPDSPSDETCVAALGDLHNDYKRSKFEAEAAALRFAAEGLPVVVVNPSAPIGPWDVKPTPTGKIIVDFLKGRVPAYVHTGLNVVDVEDVALGHWLAAKKGRAGERYILGNENISLKNIYRALGEVAGLAPPFLRVPYPLVLTMAYGSEGVACLTKKRPRIPLGAVRMARRFMYFTAEKAVRELGFPKKPIEPAFRRAVAWFRENHYA